MQVVVVTGHSSSSIETGWDIMRSLDVAAAAPSQIETEDPVVFHQKLSRARKIGPADEPGQIKPGRMWQRLAENLLVNNVESDVWGWGDAQSSRLLDFWAGIDQSVHFVLLYVAPEVDLAMSLAVTDQSDKDPNGRLISWRLKNSELLDFYSRNRDRSLLINTYALIRSPDRIGARLTDRFGIELPSSVRNPIASIGYPVSAMRSFLARTLIEDSDAIELYQELETASDLPADPNFARDEAETAWSEYISLIDSHSQLKAAQSEAEKTKQALEEARRAIDDARKAQENAQHELNASRSQLKEAQTEVKTGEQTQSQLRIQISELQRNLDEARQANEEQTKENELLLVQLHQVQEELEDYYLRAQETDIKLKQQTQDLDKERSHAKDREKKLSESQKASENLTRELAGTRDQLKKAENTIKQTQAKIVQETEAKLKQQAQELEGTRDQLNRAETTAKNMQATLKSKEQEQSRLREQVASLQKNLDKSQKDAEERTKENELLLVQLHQVQEELENYYLKYKESQQALQEPPVITEPASQHKNKLNGKNGHDTLADDRGLVRAYLNKRKTAKRLKRKIAVIKRSNLFDEQWYLKEYPDVAQSGMDPVRHYIKFGAEEGRDPSLAFDTRFYQQSNPDLNGSEVNPLIHYISQGKKEGRQTRP